MVCIVNGFRRPNEPVAAVCSEPAPAMPLMVSTDCTALQSTQIELVVSHENRDPVEGTHCNHQSARMWEIEYICR